MLIMANSERFRYKYSIQMKYVLGQSQEFSDASDYPILFILECIILRVKSASICL